MAGLVSSTTIPSMRRVEPAGTSCFEDGVLVTVNNIRWGLWSPSPWPLRGLACPGLALTPASGQGRISIDPFPRSLSPLGWALGFGLVWLRLPALGLGSPALGSGYPGKAYHRPHP